MSFARSCFFWASYVCRTCAPFQDQKISQPGSTVSEKITTSWAAWWSCSARIGSLNRSPSGPPIARGTSPSPIQRLSASRVSPKPSRPLPSCGCGMTTVSTSIRISIRSLAILYGIITIPQRPSPAACCFRTLRALLTAIHTAASFRPHTTTIPFRTYRKSSRPREAIIRARTMKTLRRGHTSITAT